MRAVLGTLLIRWNFSHKYVPILTYSIIILSLWGRFNPSAPISQTENMPDFAGSPILPFILLTLNGRKSHHDKKGENGSHLTL
jgi:hypothetical protein